MTDKKLPKLDLNITNRCNYHCVHCAFDSGCQKMDELSLQHLEQILAQTKELGGEKVDITGGEPTVREDLDDIIKAAKAVQYKVELVTNGSLLTFDRLAYFKDLGLDALAISIDGSDYKKYHQIRKVSEPSYRRVLKTIQNSLSLGFVTKINTVVFSSNLHDTPAITEHCIEWGAHEHGIYYFTPVGRGARTLECPVDPRTWLGFIRENLMQHSSRIKMSIEVPLIEKGHLEQPIGCLLEDDPYHLQILPNGEVYPCAILASYRQPIANLHEKNIMTVWQDPALWKTYCASILEKTFAAHNGFCWNTSSIDLDAYKDRYEFVCPLRKFSLEELA